MTGSISIYEDRKKYSEQRLLELREKIGILPGILDPPNFTIFGAGSYGRHEASSYSDIDMFFLCNGKSDPKNQLREVQLGLFGKMIDTIHEMGFPRFSNDCQYLSLLYTDDMFSNLGSPKDDHENYFTVRMLMLLESKCLYGDSIYDEIISNIVKSYYRDYPDHKDTFKPTFLLNDICRYWKTILLNYENKRNRQGATEEQKVKQKVRNFKVKFSRMTTCFATIAAIASYQNPVTEENVIEQTRLTPRERLEAIPSRVPASEDVVNTLLSEYAWFLDMTGLSTDELNNQFSDKEKRTQMFDRANKYGHQMFDLLKTIDQSNEPLLRYLVI